MNDKQSASIEVDRLLKERDAYSSALRVAASTFREKVKELSILKRMGDLPRFIGDERALCAEIVDIIIDETNAENCSLWLLDRSNEFIELKAVRGQTDPAARSFSSESDDVIRISLGQGAAGWTAKNGWPLLIKDVTKSKRFAKKESKVSSAIHSLLCLPIKNGDTTLGVVNLSHPNIGMFSRDNRRALTLIVSQAALNFSILFLLGKVHLSNEQLEKMVEERTAELVETNKKLLHEADERTQAESELRKAKEQAEEASRLKDKFVSLVSHDLQSPITSIMGLMRLICDDEQNPLSDGHKKLFEGAISSGERMITIIETLLDISMLQTGKIIPSLGFIDGRALVEIGIGNVRYIASDKGVFIKNNIGHGTRLYADMNLLAQVIQNLLSNAIKFSNRGASIDIYTPEEGESRIAIKDTGVGISEKNSKNIFRHDVKTTTTGTEGEPGTGLGLPLGFDIMKAHGGELSVESVKGEGSTFYLKLKDETPYVLVMDDDSPARDQLKQLLDELNTCVTQVDSVEKAISNIELKTPHLIIAELKMKAGSGFELLKLLTRYQKTRDIPVIVITADHKIETREKALRLGAVDFVAKPVVSEEFIPRVRKFII